MPGSKAPELGFVEGAVRWAILGVGIAGRARARAIVEEPRGVLAAVHRGRFADELPVIHLERAADAIAAADAVAVCSPTRCHAEQVAAVLEAGRHVVVEFPMAADPGTAAALFESARRADRVLHVEHIELLDPVAVALRRRVEREDLRSVALSSRVRGPADLSGAALALRCVAGLHRVVDVAGPMARVDAVALSPGGLSAQLRSTEGVPVSVALRVGPELERATELELDDGRTWRQRGRALTADGEPVALPASAGLFATDHQIATDRILEAGEPYVSEEQILHVLELVAMLGEGRTGHPPFAVL